MKEKIGIWIDHRRAWIIIPAAKRTKATVIQVESGIEEHTHMASGLRSDITPGSMDRMAEDNHQRNIQQHLHKFYDQVVGKMIEAKTIVIFGPGQAKVELKNRLADLRPGWNNAEVRPAEKMTQTQIVNWVKNYQPEKVMTA
ncbi:MAG: hypothetical protein ACOYXC_03395 [Candidatus Rifleibacteriota bacterium]